jgi:hypothetical protein
LFISAFLWGRPEGSQTNAWIIGVGIVVAAFWALRTEGTRLVNTALAAWLFFAAVAIFRTPGLAMANDVIVAIAVFILSLMPNLTRSGRGTTAGPTVSAR